MQIQLTNQTGAYDLTQLATNVKWSGDYQQAARSLAVTILSTPKDDSIPVVDCPLGSGVLLSENGETLFDGFITSRPKTTEGNTITLSCYDRGFYLKRNKELYKFTATTAEAAAARVAGDFGIQVGSLASTGVQLNRLFVTGRESLYDIIATMYSLAAQTTGEKYHIGFRGAKLYVTAKGPDDRTLIIRGRSNLIAATVTESIEGMVNAVKIYDENLDLVREEKDDSLVGQYGRLQEVLIQNQPDDKAAEAGALLRDNGVSQKITVDSLGDTRSVTGGSVVVQEPYTGLYGLFYIDSDIHEWKRGQYFNKLVVGYKRMMDEKEAGSLPAVSSSSTASSGVGNGSDSGSSWIYRNKGDS